MGDARWRIKNTRSHTVKSIKSNTLICAIALASMGLSSLSFAHGNDRRNAHQPRPHIRNREIILRQLRATSRPHGGPQVIPHYHARPIVIDNRQGNRFGHKDMRRNDRGYYYNARGPEFRRGRYIPREFRNRQYVVNNYQSYRLAPPPRGQQWVQVGSDYVLVAIATGLIANIILNH